MTNTIIAKIASREGSNARSGWYSPYFDLESSIAVADQIHKQGGGICEPNQLVTWLGYKTTKSGTYMTRISAANKHFGVIEVNGDQITLTERAKKILTPVMPNEVIEAKVDAFLSVPLFSKVYEQYKGSQLPPEAGLRNLFENTYQVLPDRVSQSVRVFLNSAEQAGFFTASGDRSRLVRPSLPNSRMTTESAASTDSNKLDTPAVNVPNERPKSSSQSDGTNGVHSAIVGLLRDLPIPGTAWSKKQKARFIAAFTATLNFVYPTDDEDESQGGTQ